ncbi:MAG: hypothetical protein WCF67_22475, partial [Chitinophagaceae bacterium]
MKPLLLLLLILPLFSYAQVKFSLEAAFKLIKPAKHLYIAYPDERRTDTLEFAAHGILRLESTLKEAGIISFKTDSSNLVKLWIDEGAIKLTLAETVQAKGNSKLEITDIQGPPDTELFYQMYLP